MNMDLYRKEMAENQHVIDKLKRDSKNINIITDFFKKNQRKKGFTSSKYFDLVSANPDIDILEIMNDDYGLSSKPTKSKVVPHTDEIKDLKKYIKQLEKHIVKMEK